MRDLHAEFIRAGARVITSTPTRRRPNGSRARARRTCSRSCSGARSTSPSRRARRPAQDDDVLIAGCLSPLFGSYRPAAHDPVRRDARDLPPDRRRAGRARRSHALRDDGLGRGGARRRDRGERERQARLGVVDARRRPGPPRLRSGETLATAAAALAGIELAARLVNCSRPETIAAALPDLVALGGPVGAYANAFPPSTRSSTAAPSTCSACATTSAPPSTPPRDGLGRRRCDDRRRLLRGRPPHIAALRDRLAAAGYTSVAATGT